MLTQKTALVNSEVIITEPGTVLQDRRRKNWFWDYNDVFSSDLSSNAKLVRLYLARCAGQDRQAWPSLNTIAQSCGISKPTAIKALKELEEKGWLRKTIRMRPNREYETTVYTLEEPPTPGPLADHERGGKADLPPVKNLTTEERRGVVNDIYQVVNQVDNLVNDVDPNNTKITITSEQEKDQSFRSSLRSDLNDSGPALQAAPVAAYSPDQENGRDSHPRAGVADGAKKAKVDRGEEKGATVKELIAELVAEYRSIEGVVCEKGDYAFIGSLYNQFGYEKVYEGMKELSLATMNQDIKKPLHYLKGILIYKNEIKQKRLQNKGLIKKKELIKTLYLS